MMDNLPKLPDYVPNSMQFIVNGSAFSNTAIGILVISLICYFITRVKDWLILFFSAVLYLVPFILRGY